MARILLCWELGTDSQHLVTLQAVVNFYHNRGHDIWVAARDVAKVRRLFLDLPVQIVAAPFSDSSAELGLEKQAPRSYSDFLRRCGFHLPDSLSGLVSAWRNLFSFINPDLILCDHSPVALLASRGLLRNRSNSSAFASDADIRYSDLVAKVAVGLPFTVPDDNRPAGVFFSRDLKTTDILRYEADLVKVINRVCIEFSLPPIQALADLYLDIDQYIFQTYTELDHYGYRSSEQRFKAAYVGASVIVNDSLEPAIFPHFKGPKIFCHVKGSLETPVLLKTLQAIECSAIVAVDGIPDAIINAHQSRHILYVDKPLNMEDVLSKASFVILNGDLNLVSVCLQAGLPVALFPLHIEQFLVAKRVEALNAGVQLNLSDVDSALLSLQKVNSRQKKLAAQLFRDKYQDSSALNDLLLQLALVEQNFLKP